MPDQDIVAEGLERSFGGEVVVDRVNLTVGRGQVFACVGPPGAGRTPLIRMLCGLLSPTNGKAKVAGFDVSSQVGEVRKRSGAVLPGNQLDPRDSARDALRWAGKLYGISGSLLESRVGKSLEMAGLPDVDKGPIGRMDLDAQRRVELAAALIHGPQVLFLDECTSGLDKPSATKLLSDIRAAQHALGMTVFLATQATSEADQIADRAGIMIQGRIVAEGDISELKASVGGEIISLHVLGSPEAAGQVARAVPGVQDVVVNGQDVAVIAARSAAVLSPLAAALDAGGVVTEQLALRKATLDDVFLELTGVHLQNLGGRATMAFPARP